MKNQPLARARRRLLQRRLDRRRRDPRDRRLRRHRVDMVGARPLRLRRGDVPGALRPRTRQSRTAARSTRSTSTRWRSSRTAAATTSCRRGTSTPCSASTATTGDVQWKLGGAVPGTDPKPQLTIVGDPLGGPLRPHDARLAGRRAHAVRQPCGHGRAGACRRLPDRHDADTATMLWEIRDPPGGRATVSAACASRPTARSSCAGAACNRCSRSSDADPVSRMTIASEPEHLSYRIVKYPKATFDAPRCAPTPVAAPRRPEQLPRRCASRPARR